MLAFSGATIRHLGAITPTPDRSLSGDGLLRLDAARKALRHGRITSPEQFRATDADTLASIGREALETIRRVLDGGDPVAVRRLLRGAEAEGIDGERRAWAVLRAMAAREVDDRLQR